MESLIQAFLTIHLYTLVISFLVIAIFQIKSSEPQMAEKALLVMRKSNGEYKHKIMLVFLVPVLNLFIAAFVMWFIVAPYEEIERVLSDNEDDET